jgi:hypothetical protein
MQEVEQRMEQLPRNEEYKGNAKVKFRGLMLERECAVCSEAYQY